MKALKNVFLAATLGVAPVACAEDHPAAREASDATDPDRVDSPMDVDERDTEGVGGSGVTTGADVDVMDPRLSSPDPVDPDRTDSPRDLDERDRFGVGGSGTSGADLDARDPVGDQQDPDRIDSPTDVDERDRSGVGGSGSTTGLDWDTRDPSTSGVGDGGVR